MKKQTAIILAAGMGNRLKHITKEKPKVLVEVGGKSLLQYAVESVQKLGIKKIIVVGGYRFHDMEQHIKEQNLPVTLVENTRYTDQNLLSLDIALPHIDQDTDLFICNADYIFGDSVMEAVKSQLTDIAVYCSTDESAVEDDVMKVQADDQKNYIRMSKHLTTFNSIYTGMFFLNSESLPIFRETVDFLKENTDPKTTTVEAIFTALQKKEKKIKVVDVGIANWLEIDTPEEWEIAKIKYKEIIK